MEKLKNLLYVISLVPLWVFTGCGASDSSDASAYDAGDGEVLYEDNTLELLAPYFGEWYYNLSNDDPNNGLPLGYAGKVRLAIFKDGTYRSVATSANYGGMGGSEVLYDISGDIEFDGENLYLLHEEGVVGPLKARNGRLYTGDGNAMSREGSIF